MAAEAEPGTERQTHEPISREMTKHGRTGISGAAQGTGGHGLDAVEKLEGCAGGEEDDGVANNGGVVRVDACDEARKHQERHAHAGHERGTKEDGGAARIASALWIAAADGLSNADSGSGGDAERNHIGEGDGVESDLVAGERNGSQPCDERGDKGEDTDFGGELQCRGQAEGNEAADALDID